MNTSKHKVGDLVYYIPEPEIDGDYETAALGIILKISIDKGQIIKYNVRWMDQIGLGALLVPFSVEEIDAFKENLQKVLKKNEQTQSR